MSMPASRRGLTKTFERAGVPPSRFTFRDTTLQPFSGIDGSIIVRGGPFPYTGGRITVIPTVEHVGAWATRDEMFSDLSRAFGVPITGLVTTATQPVDGLATVGALYYTVPRVATVAGLFRARKQRKLFSKTGGFGIDTQSVEAIIII